VTCPVPSKGPKARDGKPVLYTLISAMVLFWSGNYIIGKIALREFPPLLAAGLRVAFAGLFMIPIYATQKNAPPWDKRDVPTLLYLGVFGVTLNQLCFVIGLSRTSVVHSVLIIAMTPIFVLVIAAIAKQERITPRKATGMLIAFGGVTAINLLPTAKGAPGSGPTALGDLFIFLAAATFAMFTVHGKSVSQRLSGITVNTFSYVAGGLALAPMTIYQSQGFSFARVSAAGWTSLVYMALFSSVICYLIYCYALTQISASRVAAFSYLQPVLATIMAAITLRERVTLPLIAGGIVIFSGVYLTERG
jgi:drug/metabolite transporter (DMT)-like permease